MNKSIRVMLCDDSSVIRRMIKSEMPADPRLDVVYEAENGKDAVDNFGRVRPDIVVLDVEMPIMDGIDAARTLRRRCRTLPIIMFSSLTSQGAEATMGALMAGANDFAIKPSGTKNFQAAKEQVQSELITRIWNLVGTPAEVQEKLGTPKVEQVSRSAGKPPTETPRQREVPTRPARREKLPPQVQTPSPRGSGKVSLVAIGVSTGGPEALGRLIAKLPKPFSIPILITQHMPPVFTGLLAERLSQQTGQRVRDAKHGDVVTAGAILIAPGDFHMTVCRDKNSVLTQLDKSPPENS